MLHRERVPLSETLIVRAPRDPIRVASDRHEPLNRRAVFVLDVPCYLFREGNRLEGLAGRYGCRTYKVLVVPS